MYVELNPVILQASVVGSNTRLLLMRCDIHCNQICFSARTISSLEYTTEIQSLLALTICFVERTIYL
jgi:hypothetical protein